MRLLVYGLNFSPELTGIGKYTGELCEWLLQQEANDLKVITGYPYYPEWSIHPEHAGGFYSTQAEKGMTIYRCPLWVPQRPTAIRRILHLLTFAFSSLPVLLWQALWWRPDVIWVVAPALFCAPGAWVAAKLARAKSWLHFQDLELDAAFNLGILSLPGLKPLVFGFERLLLRYFDRISTISHALMQCLLEKGLDPQRAELFPNWVDTDQIYPLRETNPLRAEWDLDPAQTIVLYSGNMGEKQGLEVVIEAARHLQTDSNVLFVVVGEGSARTRIEAEAADLSNVRFFPLQPLESLNLVLNLGDIHLLPQRAEADKAVMPSKLTGILACGGAVIATATPQSEVGSLVKEIGGLLTTPGDGKALAQAIETLAKNPQHRRRIQEQARAYAVDHIGKHQVLQGFYEKLLMLTTEEMVDCETVRI